MVGRSSELAALKPLLAQARLVTLVGPPGVGKTRLALELARDGAAPTGGSTLVELGGLAEPGQVPHAFASALGATGPDASAEALRQALGDRALLLVADNCEHVASSCASLLRALLRGSPRLRVLATSREPLGVEGVVTFQVHPLALPREGPDRLREVAQSDAARLFVERAQAAVPGFQLDAQNADAVGRAVERLGGLPLAIELAMPLLRTVGAERLAGWLREGLPALSGARRATLPHHQGMSPAIEWSHELLSPPERVLFRRLAVFAGLFTLEAAEAVCHGGELSREALLPLFAQLVAKSLVLASPAGGDRYEMLAPLRQFAQAQLERTGEAKELAERHARHLAAQAPAPRPAVAGAELFRREGEAWLVTWRKSVLRLPDSKGLRYLQRLLVAPGDAVPSLELVYDTDEARAGAGDAGEMLDHRARDEYRRRLSAVREELEEAEGRSDLGRAEAAQREIEFLSAELSRAFGLGGRSRRAASDAERARINATRAIRGAIERIAVLDAGLGDHLQSSITTGATCSYAPVPPGSTRWTA
jgi:predicted ATPase